MVAHGSRMISALNYKDADAAVDWLVRAFGFEARAVYRDEAGRVVHAELSFGNGMIMIGPDDGGEFGRMVMTLPERAGGRCTQSIYVIVDDVDALHSLDRARERGFRAMQFNLVVSTNVRAVRLWHSLGFETVGRLPHAFSHPTLGDVDALVMFRSLR